MPRPVPSYADNQKFDIADQINLEVDKVTLQGWDPEVIILDWIGGGLDRAANADKMRHIYQAAADAVVDHGKVTGRVMIATAQLSKAKATRKKVITPDMLAECTSMTDNMTNFLGISSIPEVDQEDHGTSRNLSQKQFISATKARFGPGGLVPVEQNFAFQRFRDPIGSGGLRGGG